MTKTPLAGCATRVTGAEKVEVASCLLSDVGLRAALRQRGFEQAARFSWDRVAAETEAVYDAVLGGRTRLRLSTVSLPGCHETFQAEENV